jgi:hypothetical protein
MDESRVSAGQHPQALKAGGDSAVFKTEAAQARTCAGRRPTMEARTEQTADRVHELVQSGCAAKVQSLFIEKTEIRALL